MVSGRGRDAGARGRGSAGREAIGAWEWVSTVVATAHLIARVVYRMLKYQVEYEPLSMEEYEKHYREQQIKYLERKTAN